MLQVIRDVLLLGHRQAFAWVDEWIGGSVGLQAPKCHLFYDEDHAYRVHVYNIDKSIDKESRSVNHALLSDWSFSYIPVHKCMNSQLVYLVILVAKTN